jgi:hypothetical protein
MLLLLLAAVESVQERLRAAEQDAAKSASAGIHQLFANMEIRIKSLHEDYAQQLSAK